VYRLPDLHHDDAHATRCNDAPGAYRGP
jgi:hypothetical protein